MFGARSSRASAFYFAKPAGFEFEAGQFVNFTLLGPGHTDQDGNTRTLSIASAPHERNLMVAMRLRTTAFKRTHELEGCPKGETAHITGVSAGPPTDPALTPNLFS